MNPDSKAKLQSFYQEVSARLGAAPQHKNIAYIVVSHVLPDAPDLIDAISKLGRIAAVIPKTSYRDPQTFRALQERFTMPFPETYAAHDKPKDQLRDAGEAIAFIHRHVRADEQLIILDHGGYFAPAYRALHEDANLGSRILGITEATENGHQKYLHAMNAAGGTRHGRNIPVYSRARSKLKAPEDHNVGIAIVHSTEGIMRNVDGHRIEDCANIGVFGFGKIGRSIAQKLQREGLSLTVCEKNPTIAALAVSMGFRVAGKETLLTQCDLLFCATGSRIIRGEDWSRLKNGVYIASATSADDEFDKTALQHAGVTCSIEKNGENYAYTLAHGHVVNLLMNGEAVNFVDKSVLGPSVLLPEAETLVTAAYLRTPRPVRHRMVDGTHSLQPGQLPVAYKDGIAALWMKHFGGLDMSMELEFPPQKNS